MMDKQFKIGDKLSPDDIEVGMIIDLLPYNQIGGFPILKDMKVKSLQLPFGIGIVYKSSDWFIDLKDYCVYFKSKPHLSFTQPHSTLSEQSITEAIKTLSQASQELQTSVSVDSEGELTIYSHYHEKELTFNLDSLDQLVQYVECVKKLDKFKD